MNINQLRYFLDAARLCNFTKAAEKNYISQSAITQQIKSLEQELETELFIRDKRKVELSPAGSVFIHEAEAILSRIVQAKEKFYLCRWVYLEYYELDLSKDMKPLIFRMLYSAFVRKTPE